MGGTELANVENFSQYIFNYGIKIIFTVYLLA
jgi:hypothetical protein